MQFADVRELVRVRDGAQVAEHAVEHPGRPAPPHGRDARATEHEAGPVDVPAGLPDQVAVGDVHVVERDVQRVGIRHGGRAPTTGQRLDPGRGDVHVDEQPLGGRRPRAASATTSARSRTRAPEQKRTVPASTRPDPRGSSCTAAPPDRDAQTP